MGFAAGMNAGVNVVKTGMAIRDQRDQRKLEADSREREDEARSAYKASLDGPKSGIPQEDSGVATGEATPVQEADTAAVAATTAVNSEQALPVEEEAGITPEQTAAEGQPDISEAGADPYAETANATNNKDKAIPVAEEAAPVTKMDSPEASTMKEFKTLTPTFKQHIDQEKRMIDALPYGSSIKDMLEVSKHSQDQREKYFFNGLDKARVALKSGNAEVAAAEIKKMYSALPSGMALQVNKVKGQLVANTYSEETGNPTGTPMVINDKFLENISKQATSNPAFFGNMSIEAKWEYENQTMKVQEHGAKIDKWNADITHMKNTDRVNQAEHFRKVAKDDYTRNKGTYRGVSGMDFDDIQKRITRIDKHVSTKATRWDKMKSSLNPNLDIDGPDELPAGFTPDEAAVFRNGGTAFSDYQMNSNNMVLFNPSMPDGTASNIAATVSNNLPEWPKGHPPGTPLIVNDVSGNEAYKLYKNKTASPKTGLIIEYGGHKYIGRPEWGDFQVKSAFAENQRGSFIETTDPSGRKSSRFLYGTQDAEGAYVVGNTTTSGTPAVSKAQLAQGAQQKELQGAVAIVEQQKGPGGALPPDPAQSAKMITSITETLPRVMQEGSMTPATASQMREELGKVDPSLLSPDKRAEHEDNLRILSLPLKEMEKAITERINAQGQAIS